MRSMRARFAARSVGAERNVCKRHPQNGRVVSRKSEVDRTGRFWGIQKVGSQALCWRSPTISHVKVERHHPRRRLGNATVSCDKHHLEAALTDIRQADDLLPAEHADASWDQGHP